MSSSALSSPSETLEESDPAMLGASPLPCPDHVDDVIEHLLDGRQPDRAGHGSDEVQVFRFESKDRSAGTGIAA